MRGVTKAATARKLGISRSAVQGYCSKFPSIVGPDGVSLPALEMAIDERRANDGRGFPLGKKRLQRSLRLGAVPKSKAGFVRSFVDRIERIGGEVAAMTDYEQEQLLRMGPSAWLGLFRFGNVLRVDQANKERASVEQPAAGVQN
jgi:hypothetical protein